MSFVRHHISESHVRICLNLQREAVDHKNLDFRSFDFRQSTDECQKPNKLPKADLAVAIRVITGKMRNVYKTTVTFVGEHKNYVSYTNSNRQCLRLNNTFTICAHSLALFMCKSQQI